MIRPAYIVAVVGTATEVGKTWVTARLAQSLRHAGHTVSARKPIQSFDPTERGPNDSTVLAAATGEHQDEVCSPSRSLPVAMAPPMAADVLGVACPSIEDLVRDLSWPEQQVDIGFVETVGGPRSPAATDGDSRTLARAVAPDLMLVVADAGLGVIDATRSAAAAISGDEAIFFLNRFDDASDLHHRNRRWLDTIDGLDVETDVNRLAGRLVTMMRAHGHP